MLITRITWVTSWMYAYVYNDSLNITDGSHWWQITFIKRFDPKIVLPTYAKSWDSEWDTSPFLLVQRWIFKSFLTFLLLCRCGVSCYWIITKTHAFTSDVSSRMNDTTPDNPLIHAIAYYSQFKIGMRLLSMIT